MPRGCYDRRGLNHTLAQETGVQMEVYQFSTLRAGRRRCHNVNNLANGLDVSRNLEEDSTRSRCFQNAPSCSAPFPPEDIATVRSRDIRKTYACTGTVITSVSLEPGPDDLFQRAWWPKRARCHYCRQGQQGLFIRCSFSSLQRYRARSGWCASMLRRYRFRHEPISCE
jgi:hypothetical protein